MSHKKATPGEGARCDREHFTYFSPKPGLSKTTTGFCACEPLWLKVHEHTKKEPGTKLCTTWFTDGEVPCPRCRYKVSPSVVAYCLWWRESDGAPLFSIVHESAADCLIGLRFGVRVFVGREDDKASAYLRATNDQPGYRSTHPLRQSAVDIIPVLCEVWRYPALDNWLTYRARVEKEQARAAMEEETPTLSVPTPTSRIEALAIDAHRKVGHLLDVDEVEKRIKARVAESEAKKNGKHRPAGGDT